MLACDQSSPLKRRAWARNLPSLSRSSSRMDIEMLRKESGLVGQRPLDQRPMVDREMIGVVVADLAARRPPGREFHVLGVDEILPVAYANQKRGGDVSRVP